MERVRATALARTVDFDSRSLAEVGSLAERAYHLLEEMIVTMQLEPGSRWSESMICEKLGIGRTPVREALQRLAIEQLVKIIPRHGVMVTEIVIPEQMMVIELRRVLEPLLASRATRRANVMERNRMMQYRDDILRTNEARDIVGYLRIHLEMRRFMADCSRNTFLAAALPPVDALSRRFFFMHRNHPDSLDKSTALVADVLFATATDDEPEAIAAAHRLVDHIEEFTRASFYTES